MMSSMGGMGGMGMAGLGGMGKSGLGGMGMGGLGSMGMGGFGGLMNGMINQAGPGAFGSRTQLGSMRSPMTPASAPTGFGQPTLQRPSMPPQNPLASMGRSAMPNSGFGMPSSGFGMAGKGVFSNTMGGGMGTMMGSSMGGIMGNNMMNSRGLGGMQMPMPMPMGRTGK